MSNTFEEYRNEMISLITKYKFEGDFQSQIQNLDFYFSKTLSEQISIMYEPSICIILQGAKDVIFANKLYNYNEKDYLISSTHLPARIRISEASNEKPYISLRIKFNLKDIHEVLKNINSPIIPIDSQAEKGLCFNEMNIEFYESIYRLVKLLEREKEDIDFLYPLMIKEILYNLLKSKSGYFIRKFSMEGTVSNKIAQTINLIKENFDKKLNIKELADNIEMSESSLYQHFKTITSMSPIQFQKKLRLDEAKQLLLLQNKEVHEIAFQVGYESPSQFSREFSRMFGVAPSSMI
jgi:AraC-like DNA-binding protein